MSRKKHFWEGMSKPAICIYFVLSVLFGLAAYMYTTIILVLARWHPSDIFGAGIFEFSKLGLFFILVVGFFSMIYLFWSALQQSRDIEKKQEQGKEIRF